MDDMDLLKRIYREFGPEPLRATQTNLYVNLDKARGDSNVISRLERRIRLSEGKPTCQVLAGHKGSGKSTELLRLKEHLESGKEPFFVTYVVADEDVARNDLDFPDVLIAVVRQIAAQLKQRTDIRLAPGYFKDLLRRLKSILTAEINLESIDLDLDLLKLSGTIKSSPDARARIREVLELLYAANDVIGEAAGKLRAKNLGGLVVLVDDLDKMIIRPHGETGCTTDEHLFVNRATQLTGFACHVVYVLPLSLAYSRHAQAVKANYGDDVPLLPMTKVAQRPPSTERHPPGEEWYGLNPMVALLEPPEELGQRQ